MAVGEVDTSRVSFHMLCMPTQRNFAKIQETIPSGYGLHHLPRMLSWLILQGVSFYGAILELRRMSVPDMKKQHTILLQILPVPFSASIRGNTKFKLANLKVAFGTGSASHTRSFLCRWSVPDRLLMAIKLILTCKSCGICAAR